MDLRTQLALALVGVILLAVVFSGLWAREISLRQSELFLRRLQEGEIPLPSPRPGRSPGFGDFARPPGFPMPPRFVEARRNFLRDIGRSLWLGGSTAAVLGIILSVFLARRIAQPVQQARNAAVGIAAGDYAQRLPIGGPTELAGLAESFNAMAARLEADKRMRREFLAAVAHELRTPLTIIQANLESFLDGVETPSAERLTVLQAQTQLLSRLITDLRDLTLAEAGQLILRRCPTDLVALCQQTADLLQPVVREHDVRVMIHHAGAPVPDVDPDRLRQVMQNLLANAIQHSPHGGTVEITVSEAGADVEVVVEDEGPGIPDDALPRVFDTFYRADPARSRATGGTGLGLAVVKYLVASHGGTVQAENRVGGGSRFIVRLPNQSTQS